MSKEIDDVVPITINILPEFEDFTTYEEVDPNGNITIAPDSVIVDHMERPITAYVRKDFSDSFFTDFNHSIFVICPAGSERGLNDVWALTALESSHTHQQMITNMDGIGVYIWDDYGRPSFWIQNFATGEMVESIDITYGTAYQLYISRQGNICTVKIYKAGTLFDEIAMPVTTQPFRYLFATASRGSGGQPTSWLSTIVSDLDINAASPAPLGLQPTSQIKRNNSQ